jgi:mono/diheme cytochrome c family protein
MNSSFFDGIRGRVRMRPRLAGLVALSLLAPLALGAQKDEGATAQPISANAVYTRAQANAGKTLYDLECTLCHAPREFVGPVFQRRWLTPPVGGIFVHILNTMPQDAPGSLSPTQVATLVAYILEMNGYPAGDRPLPTALDQLSQIRLPPPDTVR